MCTFHEYSARCAVHMVHTLQSSYQSSHRPLVFAVKPPRSETKYFFSPYIFYHRIRIEAAKYVCTPYSRLHDNIIWHSIFALIRSNRKYSKQPDQIFWQSVFWLTRPNIWAFEIAFTAEYLNTLYSYWHCQIFGHSIFAMCGQILKKIESMTPRHRFLHEMRVNTTI